MDPMSLWLVEYGHRLPTLLMDGPSIRLLIRTELGQPGTLIGRDQLYNTRILNDLFIGNTEGSDYDVCRYGLL